MTTDPANAAETTPDQADPTSDGPRGADQFLRDTRTEKVLIDNHLDPEFIIVDLADIDLSALDNGEPERQMRDEVIHLDVAQRYADDLSWGSQFPAGVLSKKAKNFAIVDFHHRLWAARAAKLNQVSAYVVPGLEEFDLIELGNILNRNHGVPLTENERIRQALWGIDLGRFKTVRQAARTLGIKESTVAKAKRVREATAMAQEVGVSVIAWDRLPKSTKDRLGTISSPDVFKTAADSVIGKALGTVEVSELVTKVNDAGSEAAKIEVIKSFAADFEPKKPATVSNLADPWFRVHTACRALLAVDLGPEFDMSLARRTASDLSLLFGETQEVVTKLGQIATKLDSTKGSDETDAQADAS